MPDDQQKQQEADEPWRPSARLEAMWQRDVIGPMDDFQDPSQEWRRLFSELLGTFFLVLVACGGGVMGEAFPNTISRTAAVTAPGLMVLGIILFMGKVSGAHLNPAVSVAFSLRGDFPWRRVPGYIVVQLIGAVARGMVRAERDQRLGRLRLQLSGIRVHLHGRVPDGGGADAGPGQRDPGHGLGGTEPGRVRRARCRLLHHPGRAVGQPHLGCVDEPCPNVRAGPGRRELHRATGCTSPGRWWGPVWPSPPRSCCEGRAAARRDPAPRREISSRRPTGPTRHNHHRGFARASTSV